MLFQIITPERPNPQWVSGRKECKRWGLPRCIPRRRNPFSVEHSFLPGGQSSTSGTACNGRHNTTTATQESVAASGTGFGRDFGPGNIDWGHQYRSPSPRNGSLPDQYIWRSACYQSILGCGDADRIRESLGLRSKAVDLAVGMSLSIDSTKLVLHNADSEVYCYDMSIVRPIAM